MQPGEEYVFINPIELYWIKTINKYFNMGCVTFRSLRTFLSYIINEPFFYFFGSFSHRHAFFRLKTLP
jgi:hypothetical protein